ncbi:hypothetical protein SAMN04488577_2491 [Bacillus sp. cl95]|nr:hypothetical protein SAMN02799634_102372 [Bacillus sp. UNCCL13]SFQ84805.1 hypothetical protein SAMN04488577_2491 [Bacillus sp. cl95]
MFKISGNAYDILSKTIKNEKKHPTEQLFARVSIGIG